MFALPIAIPFRRPRRWQTVLVLFGVVWLRNDHRHHILIGRRVQRRYSTSGRKWIWTALPEGHADLSARPLR